MSSLGPSGLIPPNDTGSDTFVRYCYQAYLALPYCLACALDGEIQSVVLEYFEDFALEYENRWRLIQVKTRDPELGPWKLADLLGEGGALRSLLRSFRALGDTPATYEAHLEGAVKSGDLLAKFRKPGTDLSEDSAIVQRIATGLEIPTDECVRFVTGLRIHPDQPLRSSIVSRNLRLLGNHGPSLSMREIEEIHTTLSMYVFNAMAAQRFGVDWPAIILDKAIDGPAQALLERKRLARRSLGPIVQRLARTPKPLLRRIVASDTPSPTVLESKLLAGGASDTIISDAKSLRANATIRKIEYLSGSLYSDDEQLQDVRERLRIRVNGLVAQHSPGNKPAVEIWNRLLEILSSNVKAFDRHGIFSEDPYLLLGEVCELADECLVDWGVMDA